MRIFGGLFLVLILVFITGLLLDWWSVSASTNEVTDRTEIRFGVDGNKMESDAQRVRDGAEEVGRDIGDAFDDDDDFDEDDDDDAELGRVDRLEIPDDRRGGERSADTAIPPVTGIARDLTGTVRAIDPPRFELEPIDGETRALRLAQDATVEISGVRATLADLIMGEIAQVELVDGRSDLVQRVVVER